MFVSVVMRKRLCRFANKLIHSEFNIPHYDINDVKWIIKTFTPGKPGRPRRGNGKEEKGERFHRSK